jgi:hypothetical protein
MEINFFEEFPNEESLAKLNLINFPSLIYIAAKSLEEFNIIKDKILEINSTVELGYWPILEKSYWISPFSYTFELRKLYDDLLKNKKDKYLKILIDLELPFLTPKLFFWNLFSFFKNKKIIRKIFTDSKKLNIQILVFEYPIPSKIIQKKFEWLGISYPIEKYPHKKIVMFYSSMIKNKFLLEKIKKDIAKRSLELGKNLQIGLGTIAIGIFGNEPILKPENLDEDLFFCKENKIDSIAIFRLGGLNNLYLKKIKKYL